MCRVETDVGPDTTECTVERNVMLDLDELQIKGAELRLRQHSDWFYAQPSLLYNGYHGATPAEVEW